MSLIFSQVLHAEMAEIGHPKFAPIWKLPKAFDSFTITHGTITRRDSGEVNYKIRINAHASDLGLIKQAQVIRYPKQVLIDKKKKIGIFEEKLDARGADIYMATGGVGRNKPFRKGLYLVRLRMKDGTKVEGWFILNGPLSPVAPELTSPIADQKYTTGNPTFSWTNFVSPEHKAEESRKVYVRVYRGPQVMWAAYQDDANINQITVGQAPSQEGVGVLPAGPYEAHVVYREVAPYGPIWLGREYRTVAPFSIQ